MLMFHPCHKILSMNMQGENKLHTGGTMLKISSFKLVFDSKLVNHNESQSHTSHTCEKENLGKNREN